MVLSSKKNICRLAILVALCHFTKGFLPHKHLSPTTGNRLRVSTLSMSQITQKSAWWKNAIASLGILSTVIAVAPAESFAADTVKVSRHFIALVLVTSIVCRYSLTSNYVVNFRSESACCNHVKRNLVPVC